MDDKAKITISDETRQWVEEYQKRKQAIREKRVAKKTEKKTNAPKQWPYWENK